MKAIEMMTKNAQTCNYFDTVQHAATAMKQHGVGILPVVDGSGRLVGVITDRDLCLKVMAEGRDPAHARVQECMTPNPVSCSMKDSQRSVLALMARNQVRRIPVVDDQKRVVGVVGIADLIAHGEVNARDIYLVLRRLTLPQERAARGARAAA